MGSEQSKEKKEEIKAEKERIKMWEIYALCACV